MINGPKRFNCSEIRLPKLKNLSLVKNIKEKPTLELASLFTLYGSVAEYHFYCSFIILGESYSDSRKI
jgi:hypothetical protein